MSRLNVFGTGDFAIGLDARGEGMAVVFSRSAIVNTRDVLPTFHGFGKDDLESLGCIKEGVLARSRKRGVVYRTYRFR